MSYGRKYSVAFSNDLNELIEIFFDVLGYTGASYMLMAATDCLNLKATTGDENKLQDVIGTEANIKLVIYPKDNVTIADFIAPQDNYIRVTACCDGNYMAPIFQGFVVVEDNSQSLLDPPFVLTVRALDCLGMLQGIYFLDADGNPFSGKQTIIGWLAQILNKTAGTLNLRTYFNIYNEIHVTNQNPLEQICLDAITFETGKQTPAGDVNPADYNTGFDDYYTVLVKIMKNLRCKLFQEDGYWHLVSQWEYLNPAGATYYEYSFGDPVSGIVPYTLVGTGKNIDLSVKIGKGQTMQLVKEDALLYLKLATKSVELTYNYNQSLNKIINQGLSQGISQPGQDETISSAVIDPSYNHGIAINLTTKAYSLFGFTLLQAPQVPGFANPVSSLPIFMPLIQPGSATATPASNAFIRIVRDILGNEVERMMVVKLLASPNATYVLSSEVLIDQNDILQLTFSWRTRTATGSGGQMWLTTLIWLTGDDGTFWALGSYQNGSISGTPTKWIQTDANFQVGGAVITILSDDVPDTLQWTSMEVNTAVLPGVPYAQAPVSGKVRIAFVTGNGPGTEFWYKGIAVKILPYLNGGYLQLQGDYNYAESSANILQTKLETVDISDSPKRYFQGALLSNASGDVLLSSSWYRAGFTETLRFCQLMAYLIYTNLYRMVQKIEGTVKGLNYPDQNLLATKHPAGMRNIYNFTDTTTPTKKYMLCSFDKDINSGQWRGVFVETASDDNDPGLAVPDDYEFSYLFTGL